MLIDVNIKLKRANNFINHSVYHGIKWELLGNVKQK